jgi:hypothetical protein
MSKTQNHCLACMEKGYKKHGHPLYRTCAHCGTIYQFEGIENITDYYTDIALDYSYQKGSYYYYLNLIRRYINHNTNPTLIDMGTGDGLFLDVCSSYFPKCYGVEFSEIAQKVLTEKGYLIDMDSVGSYKSKVVSALQVLEHVSNPDTFLDGFCLQQGDYAVLTSPAADTRYALRYKELWRNISPSHHLAMYTKKAIEIIAERHNMEIVYYENTWSATNNFWHNLWTHMKTYAKWPIKKLIGRKDPFPRYNWRDSFFVILKQK